MFRIQVEYLLIENITEDRLGDPAQALGHKVVQPAGHLTLQFLGVSVMIDQ